MPELVLAFDFGLRRIGTACGDTVSRTARPLAAIDNGPKGPAWAAVDSLVREWEPGLLVVGLPYHVNDAESTMTVAARAFAGALESRYALPVRLVDERYSSLEAQGRLKERRGSGLSHRRVLKEDIDGAAASIILERWFLEYE